MTEHLLNDLWVGAIRIPPNFPATYNDDIGNVWQMKVLMTLMLVFLLAGCAAGQGDAGQPSTEDTTANGTEETASPTGVGDLPQPPDSTLSYSGREVKGMLGTYCWTFGNSAEDSFGCVDAFWPPPIPSKQETLTVPPTSEMVFRYEGQNLPRTVEAGAYEKTAMMRPEHSLKAHGSGVQRTISAELPPGEYVLEVSIEKQRYNASYYFRIMVQ